MDTRDRYVMVPASHILFHFNKFTLCRFHSTCLLNYIQCNGPASQPASQRTNSESARNPHIIQSKYLMYPWQYKFLKGQIRIYSLGESESQIQGNSLFYTFESFCNYSTLWLYSCRILISRPDKLSVENKGSLKLLGKFKFCNLQVKKEFPEIKF